MLWGALACAVGFSGASLAQSPANGFQLDRIAADAGYGFTPDRPIPLGGSATGQFRDRLNQLHDLLRGPRGEPLSFAESGTCCVSLDPDTGETRSIEIYDVAAEGYRPFRLYIDGHTDGAIQTPLGFLATMTADHADMLAIAERAVGFGDLNGAAEALRPLAQAGDLAGQFALARILGDLGQTDEAGSLYEALANARHPVAQALLAARLENGVGGPANPDAAKTWWRKAAANGDGSSLLRVARDVIGTGQDQAALRAAAPLLAAAAERGTPGAQAAYGLMLVNGRGVRQDPVAGLTWLYLAQRVGDPNARAYYAQVTPGLTSETVSRIERNAEAWLAEPGPPPAVELPEAD